MSLLTFGEIETQLVGMRHEPAGQLPRGTCVVMCAPFGHECTESLRAMRLLGSQLARKGFDVLRFDYRGTGDSMGDADEVTFDDWCTDTELAIEQARRLSGASRVALVGIRLGGLIAATVAARRRDIDALIMWGPVMSGRAHAHALRLAHMTWLELELAERPKASAWVREGEVLGHTFEAPLRETLATIDLNAIPHAPARRVLVVAHDPAAPLPSWSRTQVEVETNDERAPWSIDMGLAPAAVPAKTLRHMATWLSEVAS